MLNEGIEDAMTVNISGPFNKIFPLILETMLNGPREDQSNYIDALKSNFIQP